MLGLALHWQILIALIAGAASGFWLGDSVHYFSFIGTLFLKALKMIIVPLIATSIITGVAGVGNAGNIGRMGVRTFAYYITTSLLAILVGLLLVNMIQPGVGAELGLKENPEQLQQSLEKFGDSPVGALQRLLLDMIPTNPFAAMAEGEILQLIVFSLLFGFFATRIAPAQSQNIIGFFNAAFETMMKLTQFIIGFAPHRHFCFSSQHGRNYGFCRFCRFGALRINGGFGTFHPCLYNTPANIVFGCANCSTLPCPSDGPRPIDCFFYEFVLCHIATNDGIPGDARRRLQQSIEFCRALGRNNQYGWHRPLRMRGSDVYRPSLWS